jgi:hypothetical protein
VESRNGGISTPGQRLPERRALGKQLILLDMGTPAESVAQKGLSDSLTI